MPSIASRTVAQSDTGFVGADFPTSVRQPTLPSLQPTISQVLRSPLPNLLASSPDSLRQYYVGGQVPQYRFFPIKPLSNESSGTTNITTIVNNASSSSSGGVVVPSVTRIVAGSNVTILPTSGVGVVTISASGGGGTSDFTNMFLLMGG